MSDKNTHIMNFGVQNLPTPYESKNTNDNTWTYHGYNNLYPIFLLDLYTNSSVHSSIINVKNVYIQGDGLKLNDKDLDIKVNAEESIKTFTDKVIKDYLLFNAYAVEVCFHPITFSPIEFHHVPIHKLRTNRSKTKFWYFDDWSYKSNGIIYDRYSVTSNNTATSKIFYFDGYFPSINNVYSTPEYNGALKSITTSIAIASFNLNQIKNGFSASSLITFFQGSNVSDVVKQQIKDDVNSKFAGENGQKIIIDFQLANSGKAAEVKNLSSGDWADTYNVTNEAVTNDIIIGHGCQNGSLFGITSPGKLGGGQELEISYSIFKTTYVEVKRDEIEVGLNHLFLNFDLIPGKVKFRDKPLFNTQLSDDIKKQVLTVNELRAEAGFAPLPSGIGDQLIASLLQVKDDPIQPVDDVKKKSSKQLTENDFDSIAHLGEDFESFDVVEDYSEHQKFDLEGDIAEYIINHDVSALTIDGVAELLGKKSINVSVNSLQTILDKLQSSGLINIVKDESGRLAIKPLPKPKLPSIEGVSIMYRYALRDGIAGQPLLDTSRGFCVKLITNNRLYTLKDIQAMSAIFGYDIMSYCGGYYYNSATGDTTPYCRHQWTKIKVKKRN